jgi:ubiquinol-cytochrome c reductase cytochrome b subunit
MWSIKPGLITKFGFYKSLGWNGERRMKEDSQIASPQNAFEKVVEFVDERVGLKTIQAKMLNEPIPGGSRWAYAFGSVLLFIFILQVVTGILLMFYYVPSTDHAYASTQYIIHEVDYGWFLLSYHFWGSSAMVVMVFAHMSQVFLWGAYKKPRELVWLVGLALFGIVMGFGFTGYLLPWDQRAYWATVVGVEIMDKTPLVGDFIARFLKGGPTPGQMTLSRFFVIHVMVLPAALAGLAGLHIFLFRKAGPAGPFRGTPEEIKAKTDYFFPRQIWKDIVAMATVFLIICSLAFIEPVVLLEKATPDPGDYHPEPEWYFLFLFQLLRLKIFGGEFGQFLGAMAIPGAFMAFLAALPFLDTNSERNIFKRPIALIGWTVIMVFILVFTVSAIINRHFLD